ncbi:MAG: PIG-L deacetylase family protein [Roseiflexaceae bacterium]
MTITTKPVAMSIMAHPDDAEFSSTGTLMTWINEGYDAYICVITDASAGGPDEATDLSPAERQKTVDTRKAEQLEAARRLGLKGVIHLDYPDGRLYPTLQLRRDIVRVLRTYKPNRVICQSPERYWGMPLGIARYHPDHIAAGTATLAALYPASQNPWDFPELMTQEGLLPHKVNEIYIVGTPQPNIAIDISAVFERKLHALHAHASQVGAENPELDTRMHQWATELGEKYGVPMAEVFHRTENP